MIIKGGFVFDHRNHINGQVLEIRVEHGKISALRRQIKPEEGEKIHQEILDIEKEIIDGLELPYRVIDIASGDLGGSAYRKYDIEAWMVMRNGYGEVTSTSNCTDYQSRRLNIRYRKGDNETAFVHTLNGTALTTSRLPIAILENYQTEKGTMKIPKALQKYIGGQGEIK